MIYTEYIRESVDSLCRDGAGFFFWTNRLSRIGQRSRRMRIYIYAHAPICKTARKLKSVIILCETILLFEGQRSDENGFH